MAAAKKQKTESVTERRERLRKAAMPGVKALVKEHGREAVNWCVNQMKEYEKKVEKLKALKKETADLEREID